MSPMKGTQPALRDVVKRLEKHYGKPERPRLTDPYELLLLENVAYLVDDERRAAVYRALQERVGIQPEAILAARLDVLAAVIERGGMHPDRRAEKLRKCAELARQIGLPKLREQVRQGGTEARKMLKKFPGIGEPGADRILLLAGSQASLAPESNGLRVLGRLGLVTEHKDYAATYRAAQLALLPVLPDDCAWLLTAHQLLRRHGQDLCKRSEPLCVRCPLADGCPTAPA